MRQLESLYTDIRNLVGENIEFSVVQTAVESLQGHQDIKDMFDGVGDMDFVPGTRRLLDILELIDNKTDALEALDDLEAVNADVDMSLDDIANADTEVDTDSDAETDSDDEGVVRRLRFDF